MKSCSLCPTELASLPLLLAAAMEICGLTAKPKFSCPYRWKILTQSFSFGSRHCDKGQLLGQVPHPREKSGRWCWHLAFAMQPPRGESWQSLEPGQEIGEWGLTGPTAATKWNWETARLPEPHLNLRNTSQLFSSGQHLPSLAFPPLHLFSFSQGEREYLTAYVLFILELLLISHKCEVKPEVVSNVA